MDAPREPAPNPPSGPARSLPLLLADRYEILNKVGEGAMGAVYRALDHKFDHYWRREVAIKEISAAPLAAKEKKNIARAVEQEGLILAGLSHRALPRFLDYFTMGDIHYIVMEFVVGETLENILRARNGPVAEEEAREWAVQICAVLEYLHQQSTPIIFRDIKPSNIMVTASGTIKLVDFGIARIFKEGKKRDTEALGTNGYAPPEQYGAGQTDARSDLFALGATLHHLVTGRHPVESLLQFPPVSTLNPSISREFETILKSALELNPGLRWQSAKEMREAFAALIPHEILLEGDITVSPGGKGHLRSIGEAIEKAKPNATITIYPGNYRETLKIKKPLMLTGKGMRNQVIIEADAACITVMTDGEVLIGNMTLRCLSHSHKETSLHTLIIEEGKAVINNCDINGCIQVRGLTALLLKGSELSGSKSQGIIFKGSATGTIKETAIYECGLAGIEIGGNAKPRITKCMIHRNGECGIFFHSGASALIEECEISENRLAGIRISDTATPHITHCNIYENQGLGILIDGQAAGAIEDCHISRNTGAGIELRDAADPLIGRCRILDHDSQGILVTSGRGTIKECEIRRNLIADLDIKSHGNPVQQGNIIDIVSENKWGCFITTATCKALGKTEECAELQLFRTYRDTWLWNCEKGPKLIDDYYSCAPAIVAAIDRMPHDDEIYLALWKRYLSPCHSLIARGKLREAQELYGEMVQMLKALFLTGLTVEEITEALDNYSIEK
jgi:F-box protein 11